METLELKKDKVYLGLKQDILSGRLPSGGKLPRETDLARELGVGRITLRASLDRLENDGFIRRIHGKGTFVYPDGATTDASTIMVIHGGGSGFQGCHLHVLLLQLIESFQRLGRVAPKQ